MTLASCARRDDKSRESFLNTAMRRLMLTLAFAAVACPALAQDRSPALRQSLVDLAYVLGESHALRQACAGPEDQYWRTRMMNLVSNEKPDTALDGRLKESFNTGFASRQSEFHTCSPASRRAELAAANHGLDISKRLAKVMIKTEREPLPTIFEMNATGEQAPR
jgi:uncharacterized protein (TIGR02301 family)